MNDRMKGIKLGSFSGIKKPKTEPAEAQKPEAMPSASSAIAPQVEPTETKPEPIKSAKSEAKVVKKIKTN